MLAPFTVRVLSFEHGRAIFFTTGDGSGTLFVHV